MTTTPRPVPLFALGLLVALLLAAAVAPAAIAGQRPAIEAHRGGSVIDGVPTYPENTMRAFRNAWENERAVLEFDVKLTKDRVPVVIHDDTLDRTTNCRGSLKDYTLARLRRCRTDVLGSPGSGLPTRRQRNGDPIPTLAEVLAYARRSGARIAPEIKNVPTDDDYDPTPRYATIVANALARSGVPRSRIVVQSFIPANLDVVKRRLPGVGTALLLVRGFAAPGPAAAQTAGYSWVSPDWRDATRALVDDAHRRRLKVAAWTPNTPGAIRTAARAGVDTVITDDPAMARRALRRSIPRSAAQS